MKTYAERLPMIDEAVKALCGKWPECLISSEDKDILYFHAHRGEYRSCTKTSIAIENYDSICTRDEFNQRKAELQNKPTTYQYGVEYETNGEKPDLADDVVVEVHLKLSSIAGWYGKKDCISSKVGAWDWLDIDKFRIVDERYKPKETVSESNWFERGEYPPVGAECEVLCEGLGRPEWEKAKILFMGEFNVVYKSDSCKERSWITDECIFRPIRTERDKLVEKAVQVMRYSEDEVLSQKGMASALIDAGWRPKGD